MNLVDTVQPLTGGMSRFWAFEGGDGQSGERACFGGPRGLVNAWQARASSEPPECRRWQSPGAAERLGTPIVQESKENGKRRRGACRRGSSCWAPEIAWRTQTSEG